MATIATPLSQTTPTHRSRALRSAEGLIAGYVHTLAGAWAPENAEPAAAGLRRGGRPLLRGESSAPRSKATCWTRGGRAAGPFRSQHACEAC
jgi:hypothetical protein